MNKYFIFYNQSVCDLVCAVILFTCIYVGTKFDNLILLYFLCTESGKERNKAKDKNKQIW